jgi:hypothetical protein
MVSNPNSKCSRLISISLLRRQTGEKIGSLRDYRQWLRDQAKYKRKAQWPEE